MPSTQRRPTRVCQKPPRADRTVVFAFARALPAGYACIVREDGGRRRPCHPASPWWCFPAPPERLPLNVGALLPEVAVRSQVVPVREGEVFWDGRDGESTTRGGGVRYFRSSKLVSAFCPGKRGSGPTGCLLHALLGDFALNVCARLQARAGEAHRLSGLVSFRYCSGLFKSNLPLPAWMAVISTSTEQLIGGSAYRGIGECDPGCI